VANRGAASQGRAGAHQLQSDVHELEFESLLGSALAFDSIRRVPQGKFDGDAMHRVVMNQMGVVSGRIFW
jgi:hypothetical protein